MSLLPHGRRGALWRAVLAAVLVIAGAAATTAVAALLQVKAISSALNETKPLAHARVVIPPAGSPETLLLIGSDHRAGTSFRSANTDTMMLVRIDDSSQTVNLMSIPRDLAVQLPSGEGKLNAAYSEGGPNLLIKTLQQQVFPGLQVNHILDMNFQGFSDLIDAIGCVYAMVDHRYYNLSAPGPNDYSSIDIQPGYQRLCGDNQAPSGALAFVRFRHTDSDVVRNARQQDFIRWAKDGYGVSQLLANEGKLVRIFGAHVQTDAFLHSSDGLIELFDLLVNADGHTLKTISFPEFFGTCTSGGQTPCYVYPCPELSDCNGYAGPPPPLGEATAAEQAAYTRFMTPTQAPATAPTAPSTPSLANHRRHPAVPAVPPGLSVDPSDGAHQAQALRVAGLPVLYPKLIVSGAEYCSGTLGNCDNPAEPASAYAGSYPRAYRIHAPDGTAYPSYVMTVAINQALGYYYTIQGTSWTHPPILSSAGQTITVRGRTLREYRDGSKIALVSWRTPQGVYWIANTLANEIGNAQMLALAASLQG